MPDELAAIPFQLLIDGQNRIESKLDIGLATVNTRLDEKASTADVARGFTRIEVKLEGHEARLEKLEADKTLREERAKVHAQRDAETAQAAAAAEDRKHRRWVTREHVLLALATIAIAYGTVMAAIGH